MFGSTPDDVDNLITQLYDREDIARHAHTRLVAIGSRAVNPLIEVLYGRNRVPKRSPRFNESWLSSYWSMFSGQNSEYEQKMVKLKNDVRGEAAIILGFIGDLNAAKPMGSAALVEPDLSVRSTIIVGLCRIARKEPDPRVLDVLKSILLRRERFENFALNAVLDCFGQARDSHALEQIIEILKLPGYQPDEITANAAKALGNIGDSRAVAALCETLLKKETAGVTAEFCASALGQIGDSSAGTSLLKYLKGLMEKNPPEKWDDRRENMSINRWGDRYNMLTFNFLNALHALRKIGDATTIAELDQVLGSAPLHIPRR